MSLSSFFVSLVGPLMARVLSSLGLSLITLTGLTVGFSALQTQVTTSIGGLPATAVALGGLFGVWQGLGILLGAASFCITWKSTSGFWALAKS